MAKQKRHGRRKPCRFTFNWKPWKCCRGDAQLEQKETQDTIRAGDKADDIFVRSTRPGMAWLGLLGSIAYVILMPSPNEKVFDGLMMLPYIYMGLRTFDKLSALRAKA